ncbi:hypothetical protein [Brevibacillus daliensis]|uniref:hypothetical protein n=1 Tax=Brevibacillus daliensis TaxID=2892995 RepID=UPI001E56423C|nr:hypothetical protein [Brevibacillus daliensis]
MKRRKVNRRSIPVMFIAAMLIVTGCSSEWEQEMTQAQQAVEQVGNEATNKINDLANTDLAQLTEYVTTIVPSIEEMQNSIARADELLQQFIDKTIQVEAFKAEVAKLEVDFNQIQNDLQAMVPPQPIEALHNEVTQVAANYQESLKQIGAEAGKSGEQAMSTLGNILGDLNTQTEKIMNQFTSVTGGK